MWRSYGRWEGTSLLCSYSSGTAAAFSALSRVCEWWLFHSFFKHSHSYLQRPSTQPVLNLRLTKLMSFLYCSLTFSQCSYFLDCSKLLKQCPHVAFGCWVSKGPFYSKRALSLFMLLTCWKLHILKQLHMSVRPQYLLVFPMCRVSWSQLTVFTIVLQHPVHLELSFVVLKRRIVHLYEAYNHIWRMVI